MHRLYEIEMNSKDEVIDKLLEESTEESSDDEEDFYDEDEDYEREMCD